MYVTDSDYTGLALAATEPSPLLDDLLGAPGNLRRFSPSEVFLTTEDTRNVIKFFWPSKGLPSTITPEDKAFAQALLIEAIDKSYAMSWVRAIFDSAFMKVPGSPRSLLTKAIKLAIKLGWLRYKKGRVDPLKVKIYQSIRNTLARNFKTPWELRLNTGQLIY